MSTKVLKERQIKDFQGVNVYVGIDVHKKSWSICIMIEQKVWKEFSQDSNSSQLISHLHQHYAGAFYHCVYEAGFCGFHLYEALTGAGMRCTVIHPADVPSTDKERRQKRDRIDAKKLARSLSSGQVKGIAIPTRSRQELRALVRSRTRLQRDMSRSKNRIKAYLHFFSLQIPARWAKRNWSGKFMQWLEELEFDYPAGKTGLQVWIDSLKAQRKLLAGLDLRLRQMSKDPIYQAAMSLLLSVPGIGLTSAWILLSEIGTIDRFKSLDHLASYIGLIPEISSSGDKEHVGPMTKRGNPHLRFILIEAAWRAIGTDPGLLLDYQRLCQRMKGQKAIVRIARKLLNRIRYVLIHQKKYQSDFAQPNNKQTKAIDG